MKEEINTYQVLKLISKFLKENNLLETFNQLKVLKKILKKRKKRN
jgi:hypothetical protein